VQQLADSGSDDSDAVCTRTRRARAVAGADTRAESSDDDDDDHVPLARRKRFTMALGKGVGVPVVVVDHHNDALQPLLYGLRTKSVPASGLRLLHFDSHPDMQAMHTGGGELPRQLWNGTFNHAHLLQHSSICSWIMPCVLSGVVAEVWWLSATFCRQMDPGTYRLVVGIDRRDSLMKAAAADPAHHGTYDCRHYFGHGNGWAPLDQLVHVRPWTLHVRRFDAAGALPGKQLSELHRCMQEGDWWLDIDEDYISCNNPYTSQLEMFLAPAEVQTLQAIYSHLDTNEEYKHAQNIIEKGLYRLEEKAFHSHKSVQAVRTRIHHGNAKVLLEALRLMCRCFYLKSAKSLTVRVGDLLPPAALHDAAMQSMLPHHISTAQEIVALLNTQALILSGLPRPVLVTIALSRLDGFLPDAQASAIHKQVLNGVKRRYNTDNVIDVADISLPSK